MKQFLLYVFLIFSFQSFSTDLKRIDSILVANGYRTNIDNLANDNYYQAWKLIGDRPVLIEIFGKNRVNQIRVSQTVCPSLDSLSEQEEIRQKEAAKTKIIQELQLILSDRLIIEELEKLKIEKRWSDSKEYNSKWTIKNEQIELRYDFHNEHKCDIYFDGFYVNVTMRYL
ncbi:hypothetical protein [Mongoliitalea daihaiensis]|uniref:hypothetical protein n=1 Tax=Mongoliitalea daihaiensis TaxID=2782006 RepID=UPI001F239769|nr:hypothetical protein [Mongoliitalea daihaiensis]UJP64749.1 hypothetical protein IPZ59_18460 [Mongoliitalea daihaiensis]